MQQLNSETGVRGERSLARQEQRCEVPTLFPASTEPLGCVRLSFPLVLEAGRKSQVDPPGSSSRLLRNREDRVLRR